MRPNETWHVVCLRHDLVAYSGVVARVQQDQVALFYVPASDGQSETVYAIDNHDPRSGANVIGRGLVGQIAGQVVVAAPLYKQHYRLCDGVCLEDAGQRLRTWPARLNGEHVEISR